ncbi:MAG TPA: dTDP-glucose 4,6-dehydratase [Candidatus Binataceae bacterium]|nr:dTDP-glucose 4,6-dehydratase [Candidatus Binataceae bacterium]
MKTLIVTGGAGFIGSNFVRSALTQGDWRVVVFDKLTYAGNLLNLAEVRSHPRYCFVRGDIGERRDLGLLFETYEPSAIVNFAAETHVDRSIDGPRNFVATNVVGTFELLEAARQFWFRLKGDAREAFRFLQVSTDEVYGALDETGYFSEVTPYSPNSPYAASKAAADHFVHAYHETYGMPTLITNCSNNYGPFQYPEKLIPLMIVSAVAAKPLPIYGDGGNVRDWLYVADHCDALITVLGRGQVGAKYNIGGRSERTNLQVVAEICSALDELMPPAHNPAVIGRQLRSYLELRKFVPDRPGHDWRYAIDSSFIEGELGWKQRVSFSDGIRATVEWYLGNFHWCRAVLEGSYGGERLGLASNHDAL